MKYTFNKIIKTIIKKTGISNKKVIKKRAAKVVAITMAGTVVAALPFTSMRNSMAAADTFMDLDDRIASTSDYSLIEIADDYEQASMGYFASGYEPFRQFESVTDQTSGYDYNPTVGIGDVVTDLQNESIMSTDADAGETDYPMTYELKAYNYSSPPSTIKDSNGNADDDYYILNAGQGLIGRELVSGYYVQSDTGYYYEDSSVIDVRDARTSDTTDLEMATINKGLKATVVGKGNTITLSLPSDAVSNSSSQQVIWAIGSTSVVNIVDPTSSSVSVSKTSDGIYYFMGTDSSGPLTTITIKGLAYGNTYVSAEVVNLTSSDITTSNINDIENRYVASDSSGNYKIYNGLLTCAEPAEETVYYLGLSEDDGTTYYYYKADETSNKVINYYIGNSSVTLNACIGTVGSDGKFNPVTNTDFVYTWTNNYYDDIEIENANTSGTLTTDDNTQTVVDTSIKLTANAVKKFTDLTISVAYSDSAEYQNYTLPETFKFDVQVVDSYYAVYNQDGDLKTIDTSTDPPSITISEDDYDSDSDSYIYTVKYLEYDGTSTSTSFVELSNTVDNANMSSATLNDNGDNTYTLTLKPLGTDKAYAVIKPEKTSVEDSEKLKFIINYTTTVNDGNGYYDDDDFIGVSGTSIGLTGSVINADDILGHTSKNSSMYTYIWSIKTEDSNVITITSSDISDTSTTTYTGNPATITYTGSTSDYPATITLKAYYYDDNGELITEDCFETTYTIVFKCTAEMLLYVEYDGNYYSVSEDHISKSNPIKVTNGEEEAVLTALVGGYSGTNFIKKAGKYYEWIVNDGLNITDDAAATTTLKSSETGIYSFSLTVTDSDTNTYTYTDPYYIDFSFYTVYTISSDTDFSDEVEVSGTYYPSEIISTGKEYTYYIGSTNDDIKIKSTTFTGASDSSQNFEASLESQTYSGKNTKIKAASSLAVNLKTSGVLTLVIGPENSTDKDDYLTLIFSTSVIYKVDGVSVDAGTTEELDDVTYSSSSEQFRHTICSNTKLEAEVTTEDGSSASGCAISFKKSTSTNLTDSDMEYEYTLTITFTAAGSYIIVINPSSDTSGSNDLTLTIKATETSLITSMLFTTYNADSVSSIENIEEEEATDQDSEEADAGETTTFTMNLSELANLVITTNLEIETETSFEATDTEDSSDTSSDSEDDQARLDFGDETQENRLYMTAASTDENSTESSDSSEDDENDTDTESSDDNSSNSSNGTGSSKDSDDSDDNSKSSDSTNKGSSSSGSNTGSGNSSTGNNSSSSSSGNSGSSSGSSSSSSTSSDSSSTSNDSASSASSEEDDESSEGVKSSGIKEESSEEGQYTYSLPIIPTEPGIYTIILKPVGSDNEEDYITITIVIIDDTEDDSSASKSSSKSSSAASASTGASDESEAANSASTEGSSSDSSSSASGSTSGTSTSGGSGSTSGTSTSGGSGTTSDTSTSSGSETTSQSETTDESSTSNSESGNTKSDSAGEESGSSSDGGDEDSSGDTLSSEIEDTQTPAASEPTDTNDSGDTDPSASSNPSSYRRHSRNDNETGYKKYENAKTMDGGYYVLSCAEDGDGSSEGQLLYGVDSSDRYNFSLTKPSSGTYFAGYGYAYYITINHDWLKYYVFGDDETNSDDNNVNLTLYLYTLCETFDTTADNYSTTMSEVANTLSDADLVYLSADGMTKDGSSAISSSSSESIYDITTECARAVVTSSYAASGVTDYYPQAVIVDRSVYDNNSSSGISSSASNYYYLTRLLLTDIKDNIILNTSGLSSDDDSTFKSALTGISSYTSYSSSSSTYTATKDVSITSGAYNFGNVYAAKYDSSYFTSSTSQSYTNVPSVFNRFFTYSYTNSMISSEFDEVLEYIIKENVYRGRKSVSSMSYTVTPYIVVQYILIYAASDLTLYKSTINVLELEPCYAFKYYQYDDGGDDVEYRQAQRAEVFAEKFAPNLSLLEDEDYLSGTFEQGSDAQTTILNRVKITGMTTSEFAGVIGDPCEDYDVIYIGSQTIDTAIYTYSVTSSSTTSYYYGIKDASTVIMNTKSTSVICTGMLETVNALTDSNGNVWQWYVDSKVNDCAGRWRKRNIYGNYNSEQGTPSSLTYTASDGTVYTWNGSNWYKTGRYNVYNSSDMNGIAYAHVGDSMNDSAMYVDGADFGTVSVTHRSSVSLRLSGNDITSIKEKELENFLELGYPVIVADDLFTYSTTLNSINGYDTSVVPSGISAGSGKLTTTSGTFAGKLDTNSQMYAFIKAGMGDSFSDRTYTNFVTESIGSKFTDLITKGLNASKLTLDVTSTPTEYVAYTNNNILDPNQCVFLSPASDGQYYLDFDFTITDVANPDLLDATYTVQLFLDSNGDGRFAGSTDETKTDDQKSSTFTEEIANLTISADSITSLSPYTSYHLTRQLPNGYYGSVAWKLKITNNTPNSDGSSLCSHDSVTGLCAVIPSGVEEAIEVNVLQIYPYIENSSTDGGGSAISQTYDISGAVSRDLSYQQYYNSSSDWYSMLENIPGYDVNIYSISSAEFAESYENNYDASSITQESDILEVELEGGHLISSTSISGNFNEAIDQNGDGDTDDDNERPEGPTTLSSYDMIIVGFTDMYPNIPNEYSIDALVTYGKSGRSMLFTHDTTSWIYDTSLYSYAGLDTSTAGKTYRQYVVQSQWADWFASSYLSNAIRDLCGMDRFGYVGSNNVYGSAYSTAYDPTPYLPNSSTALSGLYTLATTNHSIYGSNTYQNLAVGKYSNRNSNKNAYYVSLVNEGTISKYPYDLEDAMFVASTHGQYFQLNLDMDNNSDGESDITVWYTLDSRDVDTNGNGLVDDGEHIQNFVSTYTKNGSNDVYEASPHDVRNNYFIYNRGNISYSGVGHSAVTACTTPEVQLFINTMIMAYNSGVKAASVSVTDDSFAKELTTDKIPYDAYAQELYQDTNNSNTATNEEGETVDALNVGAYYPVYFTVTDLNVGIQTSSIKVNCSYGMRSEQYTYDSETGTSTKGTYSASYSTSTTPTNPYPTYLCADTDGDGVIDSRTQLTASGGYYTIYTNDSGSSESNAFVTYYIEVDVPIYDLDYDSSGSVVMSDTDTLDIYVHSALTGTVNSVTSTVYSTDSMSLLRQELYDLD